MLQVAVVIRKKRRKKKKQKVKDMCMLLGMSQSFKKNLNVFNIVSIFW